MGTAAIGDILIKVERRLEISGGKNVLTFGARTDNDVFLSMASEEGWQQLCRLLLISNGEAGMMLALACIISPRSPPQVSSGKKCFFHKVSAASGNQLRNVDIPRHLLRGYLS